MRSIRVRIDGTSDSGIHSTSTHTSVVKVTATEWSDMCTKLGSTTHQVRVDITYDNAAAGTSKPLIGSPVFTLV